MNTTKESLTRETVVGVLKEHRFVFESEHIDGVLRAIRSSDRQAAKVPGALPFNEHQFRIVVQQTARYIFAKNVEGLQGWLHTGNRIARSVWAGLTGCPLPKGVRATDGFLESYFKRQARLTRCREYLFNKQFRRERARLAKARLNAQRALDCAEAIR
ncbi:MAG: hypothetical protein RIF32_19025 [Leptospirales bacterium]|jgi:hypothetical protein